ISYALFGKASGGLRNGKMLRSDYAERRAKTHVDLEFLSGGNVYRVRREITPHIARTTEEVTYTDSVSLTLPDGTVLDRSRDVDAKLLEVVGLDRDQFAQIVMIAQNDFLRFLQSGTDDRVKILRRIFGTGTLKFFQESLKTQAKEQEDRRKAILRDFEKHGIDPYRRDIQFAEWEEQIKNDEAGVKQSDEKLAEYDKAAALLAGKLAVAEGLSKSFAGLDAQRLALEVHNAGREEMAALSARKQRGETALRKVKPVADKAVEASKAHKAAVAELDKAKAGEQKASLAYERAEKTLSALPPPETAQLAFDGLRAHWEQTAEKYKRLTSVQNDYNTICGRMKNLTSAQNEIGVSETRYKAEKSKYDDLYLRFLRGQAGLLAESLADGQPCPVCGSRSHPAPAALHGGKVSEDALHDQQRKAESEKLKLERISGVCAMLRAEVDTLKERFLKDFREYVREAVWNTAPDELTAVLIKTNTRAAELAEKKNAAESALAALKKNLESAAKAHTDGKAELSAARTLAAERENREKELRELYDTAKREAQAALAANGFSDSAGYAAALITEDELTALTKSLADYEENGKRISRDISRLESETAGRERPDLEKLNAQAARLKAEADTLRTRRESMILRIENISRMLRELKKSAEALVKSEKEYAALKSLSDTANGRLDFETYAQTAYFERVLHAANIRLKVMSQNRYILLRKAEGGDRRKRMGLEIEVADSYTGKSRSANSLSGGESFMASLSLALGLSDVVQQNAGGIRLDAMFIDEGFGSLDAEVLELAVRTLSDMAGGNRTVGIISHVSELRERIDKQVRVEKTTAGSKISLVV
ncbi:MAG: SMC family ATPase, partial [Oscillospiraceae bacterium]|nr:SMC family ATPase [Oscillospiraceae bacterium]